MHNHAVHLWDFSLHEWMMLAALLVKYQMGRGRGDQLGRGQCLRCAKSIGDGDRCHDVNICCTRMSYRDRVSTTRRFGELVRDIPLSFDDTRLEMTFVFRQDREALARLQTRVRVADLG